MTYGTFNEEAQAVWDFVRCQRADGTFYGSPSGRCKKGKEVGEKAEGEKGEARSYEDMIAEAETKRTAARKAQSKGDIDAAGKLFQEASAIQEAAIKQKYFNGSGGTASPIVPASKPVAKKESKKEAPAGGEAALRIYILGGGMEGGSMLQTNMKLRGVDKKEMTAEEKTQVKAMDSLLKTLPQNPGKPHFRGLYLDPDKDKKLIASLKEGGTIKDRGFSSYSRDIEQAREFADQGIGRPFVIVNRSNELRDVSKYAPEQYSDQQESILPRNTAMRISRVQERDGITYLFTD